MVTWRKGGTLFCCVFCCSDCGNINKYTLNRSVKVKTISFSFNRLIRNIISFWLLYDCLFFIEWYSKKNIYDENVRVERLILPTKKYISIDRIIVADVSLRGGGATKERFIVTSNLDFSPQKILSEESKKLTKKNHLSDCLEFIINRLQRIQKSHPTWFIHCPVFFF